MGFEVMGDGAEELSTRTYLVAGREPAQPDFNHSHAVHRSPDRARAAAEAASVCRDRCEKLWAHRALPGALAEVSDIVHPHRQVSRDVGEERAGAAPERWKLTASPAEFCAEREQLCGHQGE